MSLQWAVKQPDIQRGQAAVNVLPGDLVDSVSTQYNRMYSGETTAYKNNRIDEENDRRIESIEKITGRTFEDIVAERVDPVIFQGMDEQQKKRAMYTIQKGAGEGTNFFASFLDLVTFDSRGAVGELNEYVDYRNQLIDGYIEELRQDPNIVLNDLPTTAEITGGVINEAKRYRWEAESTAQSSKGFVAGAAEFTGAAAGAIRDPVNAATLFVGASGKMKLARRIMTEGLLGAGVQAVQQEQEGFTEWKAAIGDEWGVDQKIQNILIAGAGGAGFTALGAGVRAGGAGLKSYAFERLARGVEETPNLAPEVKVTSEAARIQSRIAHIKENAPNVQHVSRHVRALDAAELKMKQTGQVQEVMPLNDFIADISSRTVPPEVPYLKTLREEILNDPRLVRTIDPATKSVLPAEQVKVLGQAIPNKTGKQIEVYGKEVDLTTQKGFDAIPSKAKEALEKEYGITAPLKREQSLSRQASEGLAKELESEGVGKIKTFDRNGNTQTLANSRFVKTANNDPLASKTLSPDAPPVKPKRLPKNNNAAAVGRNIKEQSAQELTEAVTEEQQKRQADLILSDFEQRAEIDPDATVQVDGGIVSIRDILDEVAEQRSHADAFKACGLI